MNDYVVLLCIAGLETFIIVVIAWGADIVEIIKEIAPYTGVLIVIWCVFQYVILKPLNSAIESLRDAIKELRSEIKEAEERRHEMEVKLTEIDARAKSAQHRLDNLERG